MLSPPLNPQAAHLWPEMPFFSINGFKETIIWRALRGNISQHFFSLQLSGGGQYLRLTSRWCWSFSCLTLQRVYVCVRLHMSRPSSMCKQPVRVVVLHLELGAMCAQECRHTCVRVILSSLLCMWWWLDFFLFFLQDNKNINLPWNHFWRKCRAVPIGTQ